MNAERGHLDRGRGWGVGWDLRLGRGHQSSGDQLWFGINLCTPVIGPRQPGAVTPPAHWSAPALICVIGCLVASSDLPGKNIWLRIEKYFRVRFDRNIQKYLERFTISCEERGNIFSFLIWNLERQFWPRIWKVWSSYLGHSANSGWREDSYNKTNILHTHFISTKNRIWSCTFMHIVQNLCFNFCD